MRLDEWLGKENTLGQDIWHKKYQQDDESLDEWFERVSGGDEAVKKLIQEKKFLFGGRILSNRGLAETGRKITYSNCYVIPAPEDNLESIFDTAKSLARTYSYGGGCGIDLGKLAPKGARVRNAAKSSTGAVSFMDFYSMVTGLISQNGRRGALMISMPINHPDIEDFVNIKSDLNKVTKANISVRVTDDFMEAVKKGEDYTLSFTREATGEIIRKTVNAKEFFHELCRLNWDYAEPGILYWDNICKNNLLCGYDNFEYAGTNPCAEEPLPAGGSCLLGSLNLAAFVEDGTFNWEDFAAAVRIAVQALNKVLDEGLPLHPLEVQRESVRQWRQIGLGIMGLADMLIKCGRRYGSEEAIEMCDAIGELMMTMALMQSISLAQRKGPFPAYDYNNTMKSPMLITHSMLIQKELMRYGLRNSQLLTCAPTGTISTMIGVSGGIEPIFANYYTRKTESLNDKDTYYKVYTPIVKDYMEEHGLKDDSELPDYFVTAYDIKPEERIKMQAIWQKHIDASISSTVNLPNEATVEEIEKLYISAWENGLKGLTIFRDGCARTGILTTDTKEEEKPAEEPKEEITTLKRGEIIAAADNLIGIKRRLMTGCGTLHCEAFFDRETGEFREVFLSKGSTGGCLSFQNGLSRMISLAARGGISLDAICDQLQSITACPAYSVRTATKKDTSPGNCCPTAVAKVLKEMQEEIYNSAIILDDNGDYSYQFKTEKKIAPTPKKDYVQPVQVEIEKCPACGAPLVHAGGCIQCTECGWSKCD